MINVLQSIKLHKLYGFASLKWGICLSNQPIIPHLIHLVKEVSPFSCFSWTLRVGSDLKGHSSCCHPNKYNFPRSYYHMVPTIPVKFRHFNYTFERWHSLCWKNSLLPISIFYLKTCTEPVSFCLSCAKLLFSFF